MTRTRWLAAAAYSGMFGFGIVMALLGAALPFLMERIGFDIAAAGTLFLPMNATMLVVSLAIGPLLDRFGMKPPLIAGPCLVAAALVIMAAAASYNTLVAAVIVLGAGGAALNSTTNTLVADLYSDARRKAAALNLLGVFFGIGALFLPFAIGALIHQLGLNRIIWSAAALALATALVAGVQGFPVPKQGHGFRAGDVARFAKMPVVLSLAFLLFFESGNEFILSGFTSTYLKNEVHLPDTTAAYLLAALWGSILVARILSSRILLVVSGEPLILISALGTAAGAALLIAARGPLVALVAVLVIGFSAASIFPTALGLAAARYEKFSGTVFGILISVALLGGMTLPWLAGHIAAAYTLRTALSVVIAAAIAITVFLWSFRAAAARASRT